MDISELKAKVAKYEGFVKAAKEPDEIAFAKKKLDKAKSDLAAAEESEKGSSKKDEAKKAESKKEPVEKKAKFKIEKEKPVKSTKTISLDGKVYTEKDKDFCNVLLKTFRERIKKRDIAQRKHKTVSVSSKIGKDSAHAIIKAIDEVSASKISSNPKLFIGLVETSEKKRLEYIESLERIVKFGGGHLNKSEIKAEMETIHEMIEKIKEKEKIKSKK